ncbi:MAG: hypothetical protein LUE64_01030 [Candidatus Gastranaerophilales bacterium]|nr:hypothetical protein [Candidatus Gastranaerophilales bacterium]
MKKDNIKAPVFATAVRAGFQNAFGDDIEKMISLDKEFCISNPSIFIFNVTGDSMIGLGIYEGDMVIVKKTSNVENSDIVVANIDDIYTLKIYKNDGADVWLEAANPLYKPMKPKFKFEVFGKVTGVVRKIK